MRSNQSPSFTDRNSPSIIVVFSSIDRDFSDSAITDVEAALARIMNELESMCSKDNVDELVSSLLKKFDIVTGLSTWSDPKHIH